MLNLKIETYPTTRGIMLTVVASILWGILFPMPSALAYEEISNFTGGHLKGSITIKGTLNPPRRFNLVLYADPYYCGRISDGNGWRFSPFTHLGPDRALPGAVVFLEDVPRGKPIPSNPRIVQTKNCEFLPFISSAQSGQHFHFQNWDPVEHKLEIFLTSSTGGRHVFGQNLPPHPDNHKSDFLSEGTTGTHRAGSEVAYAVDKTGVVLFRCRYHEFMEGWSVLLSHPYVTIAGNRGEFSITDIPPGTYNLVIWHPMGQTTTPIKILQDSTVNLGVDILSTPTIVYPEDPVKADPYGIDLVGDAHIVPTAEVQEWSLPPEGIK